MNAPHPSLLPVIPPRRCNAVSAFVFCMILAVSFPVRAAIPSPPFDLEAPPDSAEAHPSGLHYQILQDSESGNTPDENDFVALKYTGWTPQGEVITSNEDKDQPDLMRMDQVFPGWRIAVGLMKVGQRLRVWIPEGLGPVDEKGNPRGAAVFEIELVAIRNVPDFSLEWVDPPEDASKTATWAEYVVLKEGEGDVEIGPDEVALLSYTGWTSPAGDVFDSTAFRDRPTAFPLQRVMPAFADAVAGMKTGERRRIWIPGEVANGQWVNSPQGDLVFEVELVDVLDIDLESGLPTNAVPANPSSGGGG